MGNATETQCKNEFEAYLDFKTHNSVQACVRVLKTAFEIAARYKCLFLDLTHKIGTDNYHEYTGSHVIIKFRANSQTEGEEVCRLWKEQIDSAFTAFCQCHCEHCQQELLKEQTKQQH